jgi:hypothetical protein
VALLHFRDFAPPYLSKPLDWADTRGAQKKTNANVSAHRTKPARNLPLESRADRGQAFSDLQFVSLILVPVE